MTQKKTNKSKPKVSTKAKVNTRAKTKVNKKTTVNKKKPIRKKIYKKTKNYVVPTKSNDFIPLIIRKYGVLALALAILLTQITYNYMQTGQFGVLGRVSNASIPELIADTNQKRASVGVQTLVVNDKLAQAATLKANDMINNDYWAHTSPSDVTPWKWLDDVEYQYDKAGENLAKNFPNSQTTVNAWMESPSHRENMLNPNYSEVGFAVQEGVIDGKMTTVVVALYGKPTESVLGDIITRPDNINNFVSSDNLAMRPLANFGVAVQSLNPATIGALAVLMLVAVVSLLTYAYRKRLPKAVQNTWRKHHGLLAFLGVLVVGVVIILGTGGGQLL